MTVARPFARGALTFGGAPAWISHTIKAACLASAASPDTSAAGWDAYDDLTNEVVGDGYTAGGYSLSGKQATLTGANSWTVARASSTAHAAGEIVRPATGNGHLYQCVAAGTTGSGVPVWPTLPGEDLDDGTVTWSEYGAAIVVLSAAPIEVATASFTGRYIVLYDTSNSGLIALIDNVINFAPDNGPFSLSFDPLGAVHIPVSA